MKTITVVLAVAAGAVLSGCVAYPDQYGAYGSTNYGGDSSYSANPYRATYYDDGRYDSSGRYYRDSDGDGVRNRDDRRPYDARRY